MKDIEYDVQSAGSLGSLLKVSRPNEVTCFSVQGCYHLLMIACLKASLCAGFNWLQPTILQHLLEIANGRKDAAVGKKLFGKLCCCSLELDFCVSALKMEGKAGTWMPVANDKWNFC